MVNAIYCLHIWDHIYNLHMLYFAPFIFFFLLFPSCGIIQFFFSWILHVSLNLNTRWFKGQTSLSMLILEITACVFNLSKLKVNHYFHLLCQQYKGIQPPLCCSLLRLLTFTSGLNVKTANHCCFIYAEFISNYPSFLLSSLFLSCYLSSKSQLQFFRNLSQCPS